MVKMLWSYQKSGSEWVKFMIAHMENGGPLGSWQEYTDAIPGARDDPKKRRFGWCKTHEAQMPHAVPVSQSIGLIRHPLDILVSSYRYRTVIDKNYEGSIREYADGFIAAGGDVMFNRINMGDMYMFFRNAYSSRDTLIFRYEDLRKGGAEFFHKGLEMMDFGYSREQVDAAWEAMLPMNMMKLDDRNFLGDIRVEQYRDALSREQIKRAEETFWWAKEYLDYVF